VWRRRGVRGLGLSEPNRRDKQLFLLPPTTYLSRRTTHLSRRRSLRLIGAALSLSFFLSLSLSLSIRQRLHTDVCSLAVSCARGRAVRQERERGGPAAPAAHWSKGTARLECTLMNLSYADPKGPARLQCTHSAALKGQVKGCPLYLWSAWASCCALELSCCVLLRSGAVKPVFSAAI
jgi:hypothetical protein